MIAACGSQDLTQDLMFQMMGLLGYYMDIKKNQQIIYTWSFRDFIRASLDDEAMQNEVSLQPRVWFRLSQVVLDSISSTLFLNTSTSVCLHHFARKVLPCSSHVLPIVGSVLDCMCPAYLLSEIILKIILWIIFFYSSGSSDDGSRVVKKDRRAGPSNPMVQRVSMLDNMSKYTAAPPKVEWYLVPIYGHMFNSLWPSDVIWWQGSRSTLAQVMACCLTAPSQYLNQCWLMISEVLWHSPDSNFTENT